MRCRDGSLFSRFALRRSCYCSLWIGAPSPDNLQKSLDARAECFERAHLMFGFNEKMRNSASLECFFDFGVVIHVWFAELGHQHDHAFCVGTIHGVDQIAFPVGILVDPRRTWDL